MHALTHTESKLLHIIYENTKYTKRKSVYIHTHMFMLSVHQCMHGSSRKFMCGSIYVS